MPKTIFDLSKKIKHQKIDIAYNYFKKVADAIRIFNRRSF